MRPKNADKANAENFRLHVDGEVKSGERGRTGQLDIRAQISFAGEVVNCRCRRSCRRRARARAFVWRKNRNDRR